MDTETPESITMECPTLMSNHLKNRIMSDIIILIWKDADPSPFADNVETG